MNVPFPADPAPASSPIPTLTLPTGSPIPVLGFGTYKVAPEDAYDAVRRALDVGYRHIDTAQMYGNEAEVGAALDASGIARDQIFLTTKVDNSNHEPERAAASITRSLEELRTDYVDLLLVHWPLPTLYGGDVTLPWPALEDAFNAGGARAIGLSNYEREHVDAVRAIATVTPHVLQVEAHPFLPNADLRAYAHGLGMVFEAWSPLARGRATTDPTLIDIGAQLGVSAAQVALRWAIDRGHVVFPKTLSRQRMATNIDAFSFTLSPDQQARIDALDQGEAGRTGSHPATMNRL
ncbi:putative 2,5-diketo-D-gluconic acid reductase A [Actinomyces sp. ICM58]|uniref:aldo/keto reductase n=1 Tax=unclassified Actinomyces TaxID=2609248 RepID=UPI0002771530|nr:MULTISPECIES: aldo/keto reductase [unclassified Actinomyces]EJN51510.1 putative 2,5-diketo-D-gluconic acid reductase A [Actinomyces sp. ICM58]